MGGEAGHLLAGGGVDHWQQAVERLAHGALGVQAGELLGHDVHKANAALGVGGNHGVADAAQRCGKQMLAMAQGFLGLQALPLGPGRKRLGLVQAQSQAHAAAERLRRKAALGQVVAGASLHQLHSHLGIALAGEHDHRGADVGGPQGAQQLQPVGAGQLEVEQDAVEHALGQCGLGALAILGLREADAQVAGLEHTAHRHAIKGVVVDEQQANRVR